MCLAISSPVSHRLQVRCTLMSATLNERARATCLRPSFQKITSFSFCPKGNIHQPKSFQHTSHLSSSTTLFPHLCNNKMVNSPSPPDPQADQTTQNTPPQHPQTRLCDFCNDSKALLYCRADSAKLCFTCDKQVHSTNPLFSKHRRSQLCDLCDSSPSSIFCSTESLVLCQNCDWDLHGKAGLDSSVHDRRSIEGFTGCLSGFELCSFLGVDDISGGDKCCSVDGYLVDSPPPGVGDDEFADLLVWETPPISSMDDLVGNTDYNHKFQALGNPPLPKNRNTACGKYKEEMLSQLRNMVGLESYFTNDHEDFESFLGFEHLVPDLPPAKMGNGFKRHAESNNFPEYVETENKWDGNFGEAAVQVPCLSSHTGSHVEQNSLVLDKSSNVPNDEANAKCDHGNHLSGPIINEAPFILPKVTLHKSITLNRDSSLSRYKEKKKTRRYDHRVRYESRKARAEGRSRIKGRFAKADNQVPT